MAPKEQEGAREQEGCPEPIDGAGPMVSNTLTARTLLTPPLSAILACDAGEHRLIALALFLFLGAGAFTGLALRIGGDARLVDAERWGASALWLAALLTVITVLQHWLRALAAFRSGHAG